MQREQPSSNSNRQQCAFSSDTLRHFHTGGDFAPAGGIKRHWAVLDEVRSVEDLKAARKFNPELKTAFQGISDDKVWAAIEESRSSSNSDDRKLKDVEFATLCSSKEEIGENKPDGDFYARALAKSEWDAPWMHGIQRVVLVHRLREVVALLGFTRIEPATKDISGELDIGVQRGGYRQGYLLASSLRAPRRGCVPAVQ